jgi:hypothetical protein
LTKLGPQVSHFLVQIFGVNNEVMDGFLVETENQSRAGTTWEPSHEWRLAEATPSTRGFQWFTRKPLGSLVDLQSQDWRTEDGAAAVPDRWAPV